MIIKESNSKKEKGKNMKYEIAYTDMTDIYDKLFFDYKMYEFPQILVFKKLENNRNIIRYVFDDGRSIIYLKKDDKMFDTLIKELTGGKTKKKDAYEYMHHPYSDKIFAGMVFMCGSIAKMLEIECPQLEFSSELDGYGISIPEINYIILRADDPTMVLRSMAHELRHLWQYKNRPEYYKTPQSELSKYEYSRCPSEIDAEAFANKLFFDVTGFDTIRRNPKYAQGDKEVKALVLKAEREIELDEEVITRLQMFLGF